MYDCGGMYLRDAPQYISDIHASYSFACRLGLLMSLSVALPAYFAHFTFVVSLFSLFFCLVPGSVANHAGAKGSAQEAKPSRRLTRLYSSLVSEESLRIGIRRIGLAEE